MGLEFVGIVCGIEETFGISISDEDTEHMYTVGDLYECVLRKIEASEADVCLSSMAFYRFRTGLTEVFGVSRKEVTPNARLDDVMPPARRRDHWGALSKSICAAGTGASTMAEVDHPHGHGRSAARPRWNPDHA